jgi:hypothetical protein
MLKVATAIDHLPTFSAGKPAEDRVCSLAAGADPKVEKEAPPVLDMISSLLGALTGAFGTLTTLVAFVLGLLSLLLGRRFFWLFIGLAGFAVRLLLSQGLASGADEAVRPLLELGLTILFGALATVAQRIMAALAGAVVPVLVAYTLTAGFPGWMQVMATLIGGLIGADLAARLGTDHRFRVARQLDGEQRSRRLDRLSRDAELRAVCGAGGHLLPGA